MIVLPKITQSGSKLSRNLLMKVIAAFLNPAVPLTEAEIAEKDQLATQGFENWSKRDFTAFIKAQEKYGRYFWALNCFRDDIENIALELEGKTVEEVKKYHETFWLRYKEIADIDKILLNLEKAEMRIQKIIETNNAIAQKIAQYRVPLQQLKITYGQNKGKMYSEEEDRFLVYAQLMLSSLCCKSISLEVTTSMTRFVLKSGNVPFSDLIGSWNLAPLLR